MKNKNRPTNYYYFLLAIIAIFAVPQLMAGHNDDYRYANDYSRNIIDIDIVSERGRSFRQYPVNSHRHNIDRAYLEAKDGKAYGIKVRNNSNERIGLVIAVDGRNIISGRKSNLKHNERMYILNPYQRSTYKGWRSSKNKVNEFYFTDVPDSYADRTFGDTSAMGVIAVAVYKEKNGRWYRDNDNRYDSYSRDGRSKSAPPSMKNREGALPRPQAKGDHGGRYDAYEEPGTGYGEDRYSPTRRVEFTANRQAVVKHFIKYEWKKTLCEMGIASCRQNYRERNRFWPNNQSGIYAPAPPGIRSGRIGQYRQGLY